MHSVRLLLVVVLFGLLRIAPALADGTINTLTAGAAITGTELLPMFQTANPAVSTTPNALRTYILASPTITGTITTPITGASTQCVQSSATGVLSGTGSACGGAGGTPGGTATQLQYNNSGAFGGVPGSAVTASGGVTIADTNTGESVLTLNGSTNSSGMVFAPSGGNSFILFATGSASGSGAANWLGLSSAGAQIFGINSTFGVGVVQVNSGGTYGWSSNAFALSTPDIAFARNSTGVVEVDNGSAGTFRDLTLRHISGQGIPTVNACPAATGFAVGTGGSDHGGKATFTSTTSCAINFAAAFANAPACTAAPGSAASTVEVVTSTTVLTVTFGTAQTAMSWVCVGL
jgi:hypothetical protein